MEALMEASMEVSKEKQHCQKCYSENSVHLSDMCLRLFFSVCLPLFRSKNTRCLPIETIENLCQPKIYSASKKALQYYDDILDRQIDRQIDIEKHRSIDRYLSIQLKCHTFIAMFSQSHCKFTLQCLHINRPDVIRFFNDISTCRSQKIFLTFKSGNILQTPCRINQKHLLIQAVVAGQTSLDEAMIVEKTGQLIFQ